MSYYENQTGWQNPRPSWESRSGTTPVQTHFPRSHASDPSDLTVRYSIQMKPEDPSAFGSQIDEVDRAVDNLVKSGKMFAPARRDSMPVMGGPRGFPVEHDNRMGNPLSNRYSVQEFSNQPTNLQSFYATQRFQPRQSEAEQMMQAKRRLAAQRERDLRNYHQEQQYNRTVLAEISTYGGKDRVMSPSTMNEEERRDLIARQHRALYTTHSDSGHTDDGVLLDDHNGVRLTNNMSNGVSAPASNAGGTRGPSPFTTFNPFGSLPNGQNGSVDGTPVQTPLSEQPPQGAQTTGNGSPTRSRTNSSSPSSKSASFSLFENTGTQPQTSRTSASSPGGSPPRSQRVSTTPVTSSGVAPIGTRPTSQAQNSAISNKRSTTPLPSPLSYGFAQENDPFNNLPKERSASAASNASASGTQGDGLGWSKVWGPGGKGLGTVASVWG